MDLIKRKAAIIALSHNKVGDDDADVVIQHDIETIKALSSAQRWIPCSEHTPTQSGEYTTTVEDDEGNFTTSNNWRQDKQEWGFWTSDERFCEGWCRVKNVVAWMPLPKPYKTRKENAKK